MLKETLNRLRAAGKEDLANWGEKVGRSLAKRVVMTIPYAATEESNRKYIREALLKYENELHEEDNSYEVRKPSNEEVNIITKHMRAAMSAVVPGPVAVMQWIKDSVREYYRNPANKNKDIIWDSPSGFTVVQTKKNPKTTRVNTQLLGSAMKSVVADGWSPKSNAQKHATGAAPNWIHSMDSALLHRSFAGYDQPFTLIHDSILTSAADMEYMGAVIREQFVEMYKENPLAQFAEVLGVPVPEHLILGDLDLDSVAASIYFFC